MEIGFSETAFAFAATKEVENHLRLRGQTLLSAPDFPTLRRERDVGYDVKIDATTIAVILQFKLGEFISRQHTGSITWLHAGSKHFRTKFPKDHHQLPLLQKLEAQLKRSGTPSVVRYLAPGFRERKEFNQHYAAGTVVNYSYGCRPSDVPADGNDHHLVFVPVVSPMVSRQFVLSEPTEIEPVNVAAYLESLTERIAHAREEQRLDEDGDFSSTVTRVIAILAEEARALDVGIEVDAVRRRSYADYENRPNLGEMNFAINLGLALGISIGFTVALSR